MPALYVASEQAFYSHLNACITRKEANKIILFQTPNNRFQSPDLPALTFPLSSFTQLTGFLGELAVGSCDLIFVDDISTLLMPLTSLSYELLLQALYPFVKAARKLIVQGQISIICRLWPHQMPPNACQSFEHLFQLLNAMNLT